MRKPSDINEKSARQESCLAEEWMTPAEFESGLGVPEATQAVWRSTGRYELPYYKVGRLIRYKRSEIEQWLASRAATSLKS